MKVIPDNIITVTGCGPELLDRVIATCNYEASGDQVVLVDDDQLENTVDMSGIIAELREKIQGLILDHHKSLGAESGHYTGLILLRS
jgi:hypothetical protein